MRIPRPEKCPTENVVSDKHGTRSSSICQVNLQLEAEAVPSGAF